MATQKAIAGRTVRGMRREPIPGGYVLGRLAGAAGPVQLIPINALGSGGSTSPSSKLNVNDGSTSVQPAVQIAFGPGFTVTNSGGGIATVTYTVSGVPFHGARVHNSSDATAVDYTPSGGTVLSFNTEDFDTDAFHENVTHPSRITIPAGITRVVLTANLHFGIVTSTAGFQIWLAKNGSTGITSALAGMNAGPSNTATGGNSDLKVCFSSGPIAVTTNDYLEVVVQSTDNSVTFFGDSSFAIHALA